MNPEAIPFKHELDELRRVRDELRVRAHLGGMEVRDLWEDLEGRFEAFEEETRRLARASGEGLEDVGDRIGGTFVELRESYEQLRTRLAPRVPSGRMWERVRGGFVRLVDNSQRATGQVAHAIEDFGGLAGLRVEKARLERSLRKHSASLGARVFELAKNRELAEGTTEEVLDDPQVKEILLIAGSLDEDLHKIQSEIAEKRS